MSTVLRFYVEHNPCERHVLTTWLEPEDRTTARTRYFVTQDALASYVWYLVRQVIRKGGA